MAPSRTSVGGGRPPSTRNARGVLVIGPGALGCLVAARLAPHMPVAVAARPGSTREAVRQRGVRVSGIAPAHARVPLARPGSGRYDLIVLATKRDQAKAALRPYLDDLLPQGRIALLQNGLIDEAVWALAPHAMVACTVTVPARVVAPAHSEQTGPGGFILGPYPRATPDTDERPYREVAGLLSYAAPVRAHANLEGVRWSKLLINSCISTLGAITGAPLGTMLAWPEARSLFLAVVTEGAAAARAEGVRLERIDAFRPRLFDQAYHLPGDRIRHLLLRLAGRDHRRQTSSSLQSLRRGEATEARHLNGAIVATARRHGLAAGVNARLLAEIEAVEGGGRPGRFRLQGP